MPAAIDTLIFHVIEAVAAITLVTLRLRLPLPLVVISFDAFLSC